MTEKNLLVALLQGSFRCFSSSWCPTFSIHNSSTFIARFIWRNQKHVSNKDEQLVLSWLNRETKSLSLSFTFRETNHDCIVCISEADKHLCVSALFECCVFQKEFWIKEVWNELDLTLPQLAQQISSQLKPTSFVLVEADGHSVRFKPQIQSVSAVVKQKRQTVCDNKFFIAVSNVPNAGLGLFANTEYPRGAVLLPFGGKSQDFLEFEKLNCNKDCANEYSIAAETYDGQKKVIDPTVNGIFNFQVAIKTNNFAPFINEPAEGCFANAESVSVSSESRPLELQIVATRYIQPGEEIYMLYNRACETGYKCGMSCPAPQTSLQVEKGCVQGTKRAGVYICVGMHVLHNDDHCRIALLKQNSHRIITLSDFVPVETEEDYEGRHVRHKYVENDETKMQQKVSSEIKQHRDQKVIVYVDFAHDSHPFTHFMSVQRLLSDYCTKWLEHGATQIVLPYTQNVKVALTLFPIFAECQLINLDRAKREFAWVLEGGFSQQAALDSCYPLLVMQKWAFSQSFQDTWNTSRIVADLNTSDAITYQWLQNYSNKQPCKSIIPFVKQQTRQKFSEFTSTD